MTSGYTMLQRSNATQGGCWDP